MFDWLTEANPRTTRAGPVGWLVFLWAEVMGDPDRIQEEYLFTRREGALSLALPPFHSTHRRPAGDLSIPARSRRFLFSGALVGVGGSGIGADSGLVVHTYYL